MNDERDYREECMRFAMDIARRFPEDYAGADSIIRLADDLWRFIDRGAYPGPSKGA